MSVENKKSYLYLTLLLIVNLVFLSYFVFFYGKAVQNANELHKITMISERMADINLNFSLRISNLKEVLSGKDISKSSYRLYTSRMDDDIVSLNSFIKALEIKRLVNEVYELHIQLSKFSSAIRAKTNRIEILNAEFNVYEKQIRILIKKVSNTIISRSDSLKAQSHRALHHGKLFVLFAILFILCTIVAINYFPRVLGIKGDNLEIKKEP